MDPPSVLHADNPHLNFLARRGTVIRRGAVAVSRIFLSHSSANNAEAVALRDWLEGQGWKDKIFLDLDPNRGIDSRFPH